MTFSPRPKPEKKSKVCKAEDICTNPLFSHGYCKYHWNRLQGRKNIFENNKLVAKMKSPKESISNLKKALDKVFNEFIRLRDRGKPCVSCGKFTTLQAGHYHSCRYLSIRWDERNVNGQCVDCNVFNQGNAHGYREGMIKKYGEDIVNLLTMKKLNRCKLTAFEVKLLIQEYETKVNYLKAKNG